MTERGTGDIDIADILGMKEPYTVREFLDQRLSSPTLTTRILERVVGPIHLESEQPFSAARGLMDDLNAERARNTALTSNMLDALKDARAALGILFAAADTPQHKALMACDAAIALAEPSFPPTSRPARTNVELASQIRRVLAGYPYETMDWPLDLLREAASALGGTASPVEDDFTAMQALVRNLRTALPPLTPGQSQLVGLYLLNAYRVGKGEPFETFLAVNADTPKLRLVNEEPSSVPASRPER